MRQMVLRTWCVLGLTCAGLLLASASANANYIIWQNKECWQTGQIGAESESCENPAAPGYLSTHMIRNLGGAENYKLTKSGQYCSYGGLGDTLNQAEETAVFEVPSPPGSYQEGDGRENTCAAWAPTSESMEWGLQLNNNPEGKYHHAQSECDIAFPNERCSIEHYFSLGAQGLSDRPWNSYLSHPALELYTPSTEDEVLGFQPGEKGFGWGYLCPVLEDRASGNIIEVCYENWLDGGPHDEESEWNTNHLGQCTTSYPGFTHNYDKMVMHFEHVVELYNVFTEPLKESEFPVEYDLGGKPEVELSASTMQEIAALDDKPFRAKEGSGGYQHEPAVSAGCGRTSSTTASEWALIGVTNGIEQWETLVPQPERSAGRETATVGLVESWTEFAEHEIEISSETASSITETEANVTADVNPDGYPTKYVVEYGATSFSEHTTGEVLVGSGMSPVPVSATLTGLLSSTTYKYRIKAFYSGVGIGYGPEEKFSTLGKPTVETKPATSIGTRVATLNGVVNPRGSETKYYFEGGKTEGYGTKTVEVSVGTGSSNVEVSQTVTGLEPGTTYHFRMVATNSKGTADGVDKTLTTPLPEWVIKATQNPTGALASGLDATSCSSSTACSAVGSYENSSYKFFTMSERWNGTEWATQSTPNPAGETDVAQNGVSCSASNSCVAVGEYRTSGDNELTLAERWNGTEWALQSTPNPTEAEQSSLNGVSCIASTSCTAVGQDYVLSSHTQFPLAERWNGTEWSLQSTPNPTEAHTTRLVNVSCSSSTACTAVGEYSNSSRSLIAPVAERWNGTAWSIQSTPIPSEAEQSGLFGVSCSSSTACTAVGGYEKSGIKMSLAERWNGTAWSIQSTPSPSGAESSSLDSVSCTSSTSCTAVGGYRNSSGSPSTLGEIWNGTAWSVQTTPSPPEYSYLAGVSCTSSTICTAVGGVELSFTGKSFGEQYE